MRGYWFGTAVVAVYMSIDEGSALHEKMSHGTRTLLDIHVAFLEYAWVIPFTAIAIGLVAVCFKFWRRLPDRPRRFSLCWVRCSSSSAPSPSSWCRAKSSTIRVFGEDATDMSSSQRSPVEETLEFVGVILAAYGVLEYLRLMLGDASTSVHLES